MADSVGKTQFRMDHPVIHKLQEFELQLVLHNKRLDYDWNEPHICLDKSSA